jgi:hypothetical protein
MADIDLIPKQYVLRRVLQRRLKWLVAALVALGCLVGVARAALLWASSDENQQIARLRKNELDTAQSKARMQDYQQQKAVAQKQLEALADVRGRGRINLLFEALDAAYLSGVWFDEIRTFRTAGGAVRTAAVAAPAPAQAAATPASASASIPAGARTEQRVELVGHAIDHMRLASLINRLGALPSVTDVQLVDTNARAYSTATVIDFNVSLAIAQKERP